MHQPDRRRWGGAPQPTVARQLAETVRAASLGSFVTAAAGKQLGLDASEVAPSPTSPTEAEATAPANGCACSSDVGSKTTPIPLALLVLLGLIGGKELYRANPVSPKSGTSF